MAEPLNWILNDSKRAAEVYQGLISSSGMDAKLWEFEEIRKDHEQIVGDVRRTLGEIGDEPRDDTRRIWPELKKDRSERLYEDIETLRALREAEQAELEDCEKLLSMDKDNRIINAFVQDQVMPVIARHIDTLDSYLNRAGSMRG